MLIVEVGRTPEDGLNWELLSKRQADAARGVYSGVLAAYVQWVARNYEEAVGGLKGELTRLRAKAHEHEVHRRTPDLAANLQVGILRFLDFAVESGALTNDQADALEERCWEAIDEAIALQANHQQSSDPVARYLDLLRALFSSGKAHAVSPSGGEPEDPASWGWRESEPDGDEPSWTRQGIRIGWVKGSNLYLEPETSFANVQSLAFQQGEALVLNQATLAKRLSERRILLSEDSTRGRHTIRKMVGGVRQAVLHIDATALYPPPAAQLAHSSPKKGVA